MKSADSRPSESFGVHQFLLKTQQHENVEGRLGMLELSWSKLGVVEPLFNRLGLSPPVLLQQPGGMTHRQFLLFLSDDFHILISSVLSVLLTSFWNLPTKIGTWNE